MSNTLTTQPVSGSPAIFDPQRTKRRLFQFEGLVDYYKKMNDWPLLRTAAEAKVNEQAEFVAWWDSAVGVRHGLNRHSLESADRGTLGMAEAETQTGIANQQVSRWRKKLQDPDKYIEAICGAAWRAAMQSGEGPHVAQNSGENEWYTPAPYLDAAREVMGGIDLDPASSDLAQITVKANTYYTKEQDGLTMPWTGNVWLNPPYSQPDIEIFANKVVSEYVSNRITQAIVLVNNATETAWFQTLLKSADVVCFPSGRIRFIDKLGEPTSAPLQGQAFIYYGARFADRFISTFKRFGPVLRHV